MFADFYGVHKTKHLFRWNYDSILYKTDTLRHEKASCSTNI